jgi:hypothetical protein
MNAHQAGIAQKEFIILDRKRILLLKEKYHEAQPQILPDGRWMAYTSNESGQNQVYVRPFPEVEGDRGYHIFRRRSAEDQHRPELV